MLFVEVCFLLKSSENKIKRTTLYIPDYLHAKAKEANINFSKEFQRYLEMMLFGENTSDVQFQYDKLCERERNLQVEITSIKSRKDELKKLLDKHDARVEAEQHLYHKFIGHVNNCITNSIKGGIGLDLNKICSHWKNDFFPENGLKTKTVEQVLHMVDGGRFDFDCFERLRKGDILGKN